MECSNQILEEKRLDGKKDLNLTQEQENQLLKQSFLKMYKKMALLRKEN